MLRAMLSLTMGREEKGTHRCACCGFRTLSEAGACEVCPICFWEDHFWEDDGRDEGDPDTVMGGPNGRLSLTAARANYRRFGAVDVHFVEHVREPRIEEL